MDLEMGLEMERGEVIHHEVEENGRMVILTNYRFIARPPGLSLPLAAISSIETPGQNTLQINSKDVRRMTLRFESASSMDTLTRKLKAIAFPPSLTGLFAFHCMASKSSNPFDPPPPSSSSPSPSSISFPAHPLGFSMEAEYARMGITNSPDWIISSANEGFRLNPTYPEKLVVPKTISESALKKIAKFRSRGRIPVVTWKHREEPQVLLRSSQPCIGLVNARCHEDEILLREAKAISPGQHKMIIFDARNYGAALANRAAGGGFENASDVSYQDCEMLFLSIGNIHSVRESFEAITKACQNSADDEKWFSILESTKWHSHLGTLLSGAIQIVKKIHIEKCTCLVHCTDGWDRTSQLVSLAQIMMDPFYRTINGFCTLIEKDWLHFGHPFAERTGQPGTEGAGPLSGSPSSTMMSPVFFQFLCCVFQLVKQRPEVFEFNEGFLLFLAEHTTSCRYGTFLCNSEMERMKFQLNRRTNSVWSDVEAKRRTFENPSYSNTAFRVILPACSVRSLVFWGDFFFPFEPKRGQSLDSAFAQQLAKNQLKQVEAMRSRNMSKRRQALLRAALKALQGNMYQKKLLHTESLMISSSILDALILVVVRDANFEPWSHLSEEDLEEEHLHESASESEFVLVN